jgi:hypothetical protein
MFLSWALKMGAVLETRRSKTKSRFQELQVELQEAELLAGDKACVYATGSFGRGEASVHSDLDVFILDRGENGTTNPELSNLDEICIKANLIKTTRKLKIREFSRGGEYLVRYTVRELVQTLGKRTDDASNTFTARLLLLLESKPLFGKKVYDNAIMEIVNAYWRDYSRHQNDFTPAFLANDILRLWRTLCVNYEAGTYPETVQERIERKLKNYKLKHSRLLTCYSALLYMLAMFVTEKTVRPKDAMGMAQLTPTERLEWLLQQKQFGEVHKTIKELLDLYETFLATTDCPEGELLELFRNPERSEEQASSTNMFGDLMFKALDDRRRFEPVQSNSSLEANSQIAISAGYIAAAYPLAAVCQAYW